MVIRGISSLTSKVKTTVSQAAENSAFKSKATGTTINKVASKAASAANAKKSSKITNIDSTFLFS